MTSATSAAFRRPADAHTYKGVLQAELSTYYYRSRILTPNTHTSQAATPRRGTAPTTQGTHMKE